MSPHIFEVFVASFFSWSRKCFNFSYFPVGKLSKFNDQTRNWEIIFILYTCHPPLLSPSCLTLPHKSIICTIKQKSYCPEDGMYSMLITTMYFPCLQNSSAQHNFDFTLRWPFRKWNNKLSSPPPHWNQNSASFLNLFPYKIIIIISRSSSSKVF